MKAFSIAEPSYSGEVDKVTLLGGGDVEFTHGIDGLTIQVPTTKPNSIAPVFRITFKEDDRTAYELLSETELKFRMLSKYKKTEGDRRR